MSSSGFIYAVFSLATYATLSMNIVPSDGWWNKPGGGPSSCAGFNTLYEYENGFASPRHKVLYDSCYPL